jgi:hypothetical protein
MTPLWEKCLSIRVRKKMCVCIKIEFFFLIEKYHKASLGVAIIDHLIFAFLYMKTQLNTALFLCMCAREQT